MEQKQTIKIGLLGPRPYFIGGHDRENPRRSEIISKVEDILKAYMEQYSNILGVTGLNLGSEQDFAYTCLNLNIDYLVLLPHSKMEDHWVNLTADSAKEYNHLLDKAFSFNYVGDGNYSPKKHLVKNEYILNESDVIILVENKMCPDQYEYLNPKILASKLAVIHI